MIFPENQLNIDFAFLCKPIHAGTLLYHCSPLPWYHLWKRRSQNILGNSVPLVPPRLHHCRFTCLLTYLFTYLPSCIS